MRAALISVCMILVCINHVEAADEQAVTNLDAAVTSVSELLALASREGASGVLRIAFGGSVLLESGFGSSSCSENEEVTAEHIFMIGSITKEFTRLLGFVLEEKGAISLDDTVSEALPGFRGPIGRVTLRQLMDHTGGLPDIIDRGGQPIEYKVEYDYQPVTRDELIARAELVQLVAAPGGDRQYSNLGYQLLAAIYEVATSMTYPDLLRRHVYSVANMKDTDFWFQGSELKSFADGCRENDEYWGNPINEGMWGESGPSWNLIGAGGLLSTADSLGRFFDGIGSGAYFDDPEQLEKYKSSRMVFSKRRQQLIMGPAGSNGIFYAVAFWADADRFSVILMTNRADHPAEGGLIQDILGLFPPDIFRAHKGD
ncbi:MAG: beta-lactamase family protein [Anaerolineae bacterium]|nr:beta-lactamase family protein [Anaerolineae bacterium]